MFIQQERISNDNNQYSTHALSFSTQKHSD